MTPKKATAQANQPFRPNQPMSLSEILRKACAANGLGMSGSAEQLLARLCRASKNTKTTDRKAQKKKSNTSTSNKPKVAVNRKVCQGGVCKPAGKKTQGAIKKAKAAAKRTPYKPTKSFYDTCDGKISRCTPHPIVQPDGQVKIKTIRIVDGAHGKHPRWVLL
tara:strand:- start:8 stop:496 length:489 start_codon:yes stop_codon:yes gene_type:complete